MRTRQAVIPLALALCAGIAPAGAQSVIRDDPVRLTPAQQTTVYRTIVRERVAQAPKAAKKKDARREMRRPAARAQPTFRTTTRERIVTTPVVRERAGAPVIRERVVTSPSSTIVTDTPVALSQDQRNFVYRTIVEQPVQPRIVVTEPAAPEQVVRERIVTTPPSAWPLVTTEPDTVITTAPALRERVITTAPATTAIAPPVTERVITTAPATTGLAPVTTAQTLAVGERVPSSVQLYAMPATTVAAVPEIGRYHYVLIDNRVFLVDPIDGVVVAELYR